MAWKVIDPITGVVKAIIEPVEENGLVAGCAGVSIVGLVLLGCLFAGLDYLGRKTDDLINRVYPAYETSSEKALEEKQEWERWEQFASNSDKWLNTPQTNPSIPGKIIFISRLNGNREISLMGVDGRNQVNLSNRFGDITDFVLSPEGKEIAVIAARKGKNTEIYRMNSNGKKITQVTKTTDGRGYEDLVWLSSSVILSTRQMHPYVKTIWQVELNSDPKVPAIVVLRIPTEREYNSKWIREANRAGQKTFYHCESPSVSPDGTKLAYIKNEYSSFGHMENVIKGESKIIVKDLQDNKEFTLGGLYRATGLGSQAWSPGGSEIVFTSDIKYYGGVIKNRIGILKLNKDNWWSSSKITWFRVFGNNPAWSPDGKWIAFDNEGTIYAVEVASGNVRKIVGPKFSGQFDEKPLWVLALAS